MQPRELAMAQSDQNAAGNLVVHVMSWIYHHVFLTRELYNLTSCKNASYMIRKFFLRYYINEEDSLDFV